MRFQAQNTRSIYPLTQRVGLVDSSRQLLFHLLQNEYRRGNSADQDAAAIELERRYLRERLARKPGTAIFLERILSDLYEDAREQLQQAALKGETLPPPGCPYTLASLLEIPVENMAA
ncbi:MAG: DUF29 domain-containing protein [Gammaproteobacteria bacterium]|nr:DUF29 domain-containing protein [Gammaproteobacteria bacterium]MBU1723498.1 DUF29 domain-containing protein [Gammaproteobacteria bacterium]MBU2004199.1 DUF29 domain-containing protein [Gammaproteobacteria bacterium]